MSPQSLKQLNDFNDRSSFSDEKPLCLFKSEFLKHTGTKKNFGFTNLFTKMFQF